jgi:hypothetical protein
MLELQALEAQVVVEQVQAVLVLAQELQIQAVAAAVHTLGQEHKMAVVEVQA